MKKSHKQLWMAQGGPALWTADYMIALFAVYIWSVYVFGAYDVNRVLALSFASSMVLSLCMQMAVFGRIDLRKLLGAMINGFMIGFLMPSTAPLWVIVPVVAVATVPYYIPYADKYISAYLHPIALAMVFMALVFPFITAESADCLIDVSSPITPLASVLEGYIPEEGIYYLLLGRHGGLIGEISVLMITVGGIYLAVRHVIRLHAPIAMLATLAVLSYVFPVCGSRLDFLVAQMFTGGVFFTAVFLLPYFPVCPAGRNSSVVYGILTGALTYLFRKWIPGFDGVYLALLVSAAITAVIDPLLSIQVIRWKKEF